MAMRVQIGWSIGVACLLLAGCSGGDLGAEVSGSVTLDGKPIGPGTVSFVPAAGDGNPAVGTIQPDGSYFMKTSRADGLPPGKYRVAVTVYEATKSAPGERSMTMPALVTPSKYTKSDSSGLEYDVVPGSNSIDIALTSQ
jgi:hypothetical protein